MKSIVRWVYIALVGLIVLTGALFIAQGALDGDQKQTAAQHPVSESAGASPADDAASPAPERRPSELRAPDGPAQFI